MARGRKIVWTRAMDGVVCRARIKAAAAQLGVSPRSIAERRRVLIAKGHRPRVGSGRPAGRGPGAGPRAILRLLGRGYSAAEIARKRGVSTQAVYDVLQRYVVGDGLARRWCPKCLKSHAGSLRRCPECGNVATPRARPGEGP